MNRKELIHALLFAGLRLIAFCLCLLAFLQMGFALIEVGYRFDPSYLGDFFYTHFLRPLVLLLTSGLLFVFTPAISRFLARTASHS
jgi:hypothetical protein